MKQSLDPAKIQAIGQFLNRATAEFAQAYPGDPGRRQPIHTVYGGAHLFSAETPAKIGKLALASFREYVPDADTLSNEFAFTSEIGHRVYPRVIAKLEKEAVEDFRIDFEDGYGYRPDDE